MQRVELGTGHVSAGTCIEQRWHRHESSGTFREQKWAVAVCMEVFSDSRGEQWQCESKYMQRAELSSGNICAGKCREVKFQGACNGLVSVGICKEQMWALSL